MELEPGPLISQAIPTPSIPVYKSRRLIVRKIMLNNFKSYFGKLEVGPFHKRFTSIVGPNGSGKSNLIESMLFIFGKRANQLRFQKLH
jgi:structural maintenance of chromosome 4